MIVNRQQLKSYVREQKAVVDAEFLELAAASAEEVMTDETGRQWILADPTTFTDRRFRAKRLSDVLEIHDCVEIQSVTLTPGGPVSATRFVAEPIDGLDEAGTLCPFELLRLVDGSWWPWLWNSPTVTVRARWGWPVIPSRVTQSAMMIAQEILSMRDVPAGVNAALGNPFVRSTIDRYRRSWGVA